MFDQWPNNAHTLHVCMRQMLDHSSRPEDAEWFTNYLKGVITYRGVRTPALKGILAEFFRVTQADHLSTIEQLHHIRYWLTIPFAEDKFMAILWLKQWLMMQKKQVEPTQNIALALNMLEDTFAVNDIYDWSTNDWLCVRVLEIIPAKYPSFLDQLMHWCEADSIWQRRSGLLAFKKCAKIGKYHDKVEIMIEKLLPSEARFIQTAIGWILSDASRKYKKWVERLINLHFEHLSHEVIVRHTKHLPNHNELKKRSRLRKQKS